MLVKICGIRRKRDIKYVNQLKPDFIGFVFAHSKRTISINKAMKLRKMLDPSIKVVGVFRNNNIELIRAIAHMGIIDYIQLHGSEDDDYVLTVKEECKLPIIKAYRDSPYADYILYDNKEPGSGKSTDWNIKKTDKPFFLAGGINKSNLERAMKLNPYCVDVSSGVESRKGVKDFFEMQIFIETIRKWNSAMSMNNISDKSTKEDLVNHPSHYTDGNIEVISYIEDKGLIEGFCKGNIIKYVSRAGKKESSSLAIDDKELQDLKKARWYLDYLINYYEKNKNKTKKKGD